jgi:hypothetical protein
VLLGDLGESKNYEHNLANDVTIGTEDWLLFLGGFMTSQTVLKIDYFWVENAWIRISMQYVL